MKLISYLFILIGIYSCTTTKYIRVHQDGSALVLQEYCESEWIVKENRTEVGVYNSQEERKKYNAPILKNFNDTIGDFFAFAIPTVDSIGNYLSCIQKDFINFQKLNDSLYTFSCNVQTNAPTDKLVHRFEISFNEPIESISGASFWHTRWRKKANRISIGVRPWRMWKKKKQFVLTVRL